MGTETKSATKMLTSHISNKQNNLNPIFSIFDSNYELFQLKEVISTKYLYTSVTVLNIAQVLYLYNILYEFA